MKRSFSVQTTDASTNKIEPVKQRSKKVTTAVTATTEFECSNIFVQKEDCPIESGNSDFNNSSVEAVADEMCQVFIYDNDDSPKPLKESFLCVKYVNPSYVDVEIQTEISGQYDLVQASQYKTKKYKNKRCGTNTKEFVDIAVGSNEPMDNQTNNFTTKHHCFQGYSSIEDEEELLDLTGVSFENFGILLKRLQFSDKIKISKEDRLFILLLKIKTGLTFAAIGAILRTHRTTISRIFFSCLRQLAHQTKDFVFWPDQETVRATTPDCFKPEYSDTRGIIDCTEFRIEIPASIENRIFCYSHDKHGFTFKVLICITPSGFISFKSKMYRGKISDSQITVDSGLINLLEHGDKVLADKGFPQFQNIIDSCGKKITFVMPPFLEQKHHFSKEETEETYSIARVRIHVEKIMQRLRTYRILDKIPEYLFYDVDDIMHLCCVLVNLQSPIIAQSALRNLYTEKL